MVRSVIILSTSALVSQTVAPESSGIVFQVERITLVSALVIAVAVLWRTVTRKDDQLIESSKMTTQALITSADANRELRSSISQLAESIGTLPCTEGDRSGKR